MGSGVTNFTSIIEAKSLGSADIDKITAAIDKQSASLDKLGQGAKKVQDNPGFNQFAEKVKAGISDPLGAAGDAAKGLLTDIGPVGAGVAGAAAAIAAFAIVGFEAAKSLGSLGDQIGDISIRTGLTIKEVGEFSFAMKRAGGDITGLEGTMRKLSQGLADVSEEGKKSREGLKELGIVTRDATGASIPMSDIFLQLSTRLGAMTNTANRNALAIKIMGKSALEVLPDLLELSEGVRRAKELGLAPSEGDVKRWDAYHKQIVEVEAEWEKLAREVKEPLAATVLVSIKAIGAAQGWLEILSGAAKIPFNSASHAADAEMEETKGGGYGDSESRSRRRFLTARVALNDQQVERARLADPNDQLQIEKKKLQDLQSSLKIGVPPSDNADTFTAVANQRKVVAAIEARIQATKDLKEAEQALQAFEKSMGEKSLDPIAKMYAQRDDLAKKAGMNAEMIARAGSATRIAASEVEVGILQKLSEQSQEIAFKGQKLLDEASEETLKTLTENTLAFTDKFIAASTRVNQIGEEIKAARVQGGTQQQIDLAGLAARPGQEVALAQFTFAKRLEEAKQLHDIAVSQANFEEDSDKRRALYAQAYSTQEIARYRAALDYEHQIAELQRQRLDNLRNEAGQLFDALLQGQQGLQQFAKNFILGEARKVFQNVVVESLKGVSTNLGLPGKVFQGTVFGKDPLKGSTDLLKVSTDQLKVSTEANKASEDLNTQALRDLTAALQAARSSALSGSGGGGGFSPSFSTFQSTTQRIQSGEQIGQGTIDAAGMERNSSGLVIRGPSGSGSAAGYTSDGVQKYSPENYDTSGVFLGEGATSSHDPSISKSSSSSAGSKVGKGVGYAAAGYGAFQGISTAAKGGGKNVTGGIGETLLAVAPFTGPAAPFVMAAGLGLELISSFLPDPKKKRQQEIDEWLQSHQFQGPDAVSIVTDVKGRDLSYDMRGTLRPIQVTNHTTTNNISAIDSQDVSRFFEKNAAAVNRGVSRAIDDGGELVPKLASALGLQ